MKHTVCYRTGFWQGPLQILPYGTIIKVGEYYSFSGYAKVLASLPNQTTQYISATIGYGMPGSFNFFKSVLKNLTS